MARSFSRQFNAFPLALDVVEDEDAYTVKASVPGINPDDVEITMADNVLTIKGETHEEKDVEEKQYRLRERRYGSFQRSVTLPVIGGPRQGGGHLGERRADAAPAQERGREAEEDLGEEDD